MTRTAGRRSTSAWMLTLSTVCTVTMALAACGAGSTPSAQAVTPAAAVSVAAPEPAASSQPASADSGAVSAGGTGAFCALVTRQEAMLTGGDMGRLLGKGTPQQWKAYLDKTAQANQELVDAAPSDIRAAVVSGQQTSLALSAAMQAAGYDTSKVGAAKLIKIISAPQRVAATKKLTAYVKSTCGIDLVAAAKG